MTGEGWLQVRVGLTSRGAHTNERWGPFSHTRTQDFFSHGALFFSQKVDDLFLVVVVKFKPALHCTFKLQHIVTVDRGPPGRGGGGSYGTNGTMDNPAPFIATFRKMVEFGRICLIRSDWCRSKPRCALTANSGIIRCV